ncbi:MAG: hypothetical protein GPJ54_21770 [Candidatus Heimdallarchaeota archaeon]|nr:hypothetical protein [Candidatus Heimdallarchaeota archaeon]
MNNEREQFETTMKEMWMVAMKDGIITTEEREILNQVRIDADEYSMILTECMADDMITKEEFDKLELLKKQIIDRATIMAKIDDNFSDDERALISKLTELVKFKYNSSLS